MLQGRQPAAVQLQLTIRVDTEPPDPLFRLQASIRHADEVLAQLDKLSMHSGGGGGENVPRRDVAPEMDRAPTATRSGLLIKEALAPIADSGTPPPPREPVPHAGGGGASGGGHTPQPGTLRMGAVTPHGVGGQSALSPRGGGVSGGGSPRWHASRNLERRPSLVEALRLSSHESMDITSPEVGVLTIDKIRRD